MKAAICDECGTQMHGYHGFFFSLAIHTVHDELQKDITRPTHDFCSLQCLEQWCPKEVARVDEFMAGEL